MTDTTKQSGLHEAANHLEAVLEKPVVPGELARWTGVVSEACARVARALRSSVEAEHGRRYAEIERQDPGLLHRVARMRREDRALLDAAAALDEQTSRLAEQASRYAPREASLESDRAELVERGIDFVVRIRTQESALETWHGEALYRDRGTQD